MFDWIVDDCMFQLETDEAILVSKATGAIQKYKVDMVRSSCVKSMAAFKP